MTSCGPPKDSVENVTAVVILNKTDLSEQAGTKQFQIRESGLPDESAVVEPA